MPTIQGFELYALDVPFCRPFKHAAKERWSSDSLLLVCHLDDGRIGYGEGLPRDYVSGESRDGTLALLADKLLPRLVGQSFSAWGELIDYLSDCNGCAPSGWLPAETPQTAAWAAVDLALLDAFARSFEQPVRLNGPPAWPADLRYSVVTSAESGWQALKTLLKIRLAGFRQVKLKVGDEDSEAAARRARKVLGRACDIRVDANMAWTVDQALELMPALARYGITSFEQPLAADAIDGLATLVRETGLSVMVDESLTDAGSLERLIEAGACSAVNVRIAKVGGLVAAYKRCRRALEAGLVVQVGCQVGETSLLSAAQLCLIAAVQKVRYAEGCFGQHLLKEDPARPALQFQLGGAPPQRPQGDGFGVEFDRGVLRSMSGPVTTVGELHQI